MFPLEILFPSTLCPEPGAMDTASKVDAFLRFYCKTELKGQGTGNFPLDTDST